MARRLNISLRRVLFAPLTASQEVVFLVFFCMGLTYSIYRLETRRTISNSKKGTNCLKLLDQTLISSPCTSFVTLDSRLLALCSYLKLSPSCWICARQQSTPRPCDCCSPTSSICFSTRYVTSSSLPLCDVASSPSCPLIRSSFSPPSLPKIVECFHLAFFLLMMDVVCDATIPLLVLQFGVFTSPELDRTGYSLFPKHQNRRPDRTNRSGLNPDWTWQTGWFTHIFFLSGSLSSCWKFGRKGKHFQVQFCLVIQFN